MKTRRAHHRSCLCLAASLAVATTTLSQGDSSAGVGEPSGFGGIPFYLPEENSSELPVPSGLSTVGAAFRSASSHADPGMQSSEMAAGKGRGLLSWLDADVAREAAGPEPTSATESFTSAMTGETAASGGVAAPLPGSRKLPATSASTTESSSRHVTRTSAAPLRGGGGAGALFQSSRGLVWGLAATAVAGGLVTMSRLRFRR